jgi:chromosome partitioning protein
MATVIAIANQKGGVGKSATAQNLSYTLAENHGQRVLLVDMDPQMSTTEAFGFEDVEGVSMAEVLGGTVKGTHTISQIMRQIETTRGKLWLAPADISMAACEIGLAGRLIGREAVLKTAIKQVADQFDFIILDCPPSLGMLTINCLMAANWVIVPTGATPKDLRGVRLFLDTLEQIKPANASIGLMGVLVTRYEARLILHQRTMLTLQESGLPVFDITIGRSIRISESEEIGQTLFQYDPRNPRVDEYRALGNEVMKCLSAEMSL